MIGTRGVTVCDRPLFSDKTRGPGGGGLGLGLGGGAGGGAGLLVAMRQVF
ncbi:MAG: hypothetical protein IPN53_05215 [Comamonadaceae bacterium]|nr:hypothetical protein [Comamonadaceae bacterium]